MASLSAESVAKPFLAKLGSGGERALASSSAGFQALGRSATSKRGSTRAASLVGDANEPGFQCLQSTPVTPAKSVMIVNDGRCCEVCQAADTSIDPVNPAITRPFGSGGTFEDKWEMGRTSMLVLLEGFRGDAATIVGNFIQAVVVSRAMRLASAG